MEEVLIVGARRTPVGRAVKGSLVDVRPEDLATFAIREVLAQLPNLDPADVDEVIIGTGNVWGQQGDNLGRRVAALAGLDHVPGQTVHRWCSSSLDAIRTAFHQIRSGEADIVIAGGVESTSQVPDESEEYQHPRLVKERYHWAMTETAENVADRWKISREAQDAFAQQSQERAVANQDDFFAREISPYTKDDGTVISKDDGPRPTSTLEKLSQLKPLVRPDGTITAGNACPINDAAAAVVVMSERRASQLGIAPRARIVSSAVSGLDPSIMGVGPIEAVRKALDRASLTVDDIEIMELNEAFAAQVLAVVQELGIDPHGPVLNPHGGGIALGHPIGATGARIMTTLLNGLETLDKKIGVETMCVGGGMGVAMVVERTPNGTNGALKERAA